MSVSRRLAVACVLHVALFMLCVSGCAEEKEKSAGKASEAPAVSFDPALEEVSVSAAVLDLKLRVEAQNRCLMAYALSVGQQGLEKSEAAFKESPPDNTFAEAKEDDDLLTPSVVKAMAQKGMREMADKYDILCRLYTTAEVETKPAFDAIRHGKKLLDQQFVFSIFEVSGEGDLDLSAFVEEEVGLFLTFESCTRVEAIARDHGIPTRKCDEWEDILGVFR